MEWLVDNGLWILGGIGFVWFLTRGHAGMGCCGGGHGHGTAREGPEKEAKEEPNSSNTAYHRHRR